MNERLAEALAYISDKHVAEAGSARPRRKIWLRAVAAVLTVVLLCNMPYISAPVNAKTISEAAGSRAMDWPDRDDYKTHEEYRAAWDAYDAWRTAQDSTVDEAMAGLRDFLADSSLYYIEGAEDNRVWSPVNGFIALAMLAEVTDGESRQQILDALNVSDLDTLRAQVEAVWEAVYTDDGNEICTLANSLWLDQELQYDQDTLDDLAYYHYASVYQKELQSSGAGRALQAWLNNNTGGLLKDYTKNAGFGPEAVLTLASTIYLQGKWVDEFNATQNTRDIFHAPGGDRTVTYMNKKLKQMNYYWGDSFGAVALSLKNGTRMWFFLPDEGKTVDDILREGQYLTYLTGDTENSKYMKVNLSVPKFDISSGADLRSMFEALGITDIFDLKTSDFTAITADSPVFITSVNQAARVIIDEQGVKAAAYIEFPGAGAAAPPEEIIDFILDRPFLFVIASSEGIPLFTGVVNEP